MKICKQENKQAPLGVAGITTYVFIGVSLSLYIYTHIYIVIVT